jgi:hypothetical protein
MATYSTLGQIAYQPDFQNRVAIAMNSAAVSIYNESNTVTGHTARAAFANKVLTGNYNLLASCLGVLVNSTIQGEASGTTVGNNIPDTDIQFQVNSIWNALAGA